MFADCLFIIADPHAAAAVCAKRSQFITLCAWLYRHSMSRRDFNHPSSQQQPHFLCDFLCLREIFSHFWIEIDKADHYCFCVTVQRGSDLFKSVKMVIGRIFFRDENRIIAPSDRFNANGLRDLLKILQQLMLIRYVRFNVSPIRSDRNKPPLSVILKDLADRKFWQCDDRKPRGGLNGSFQ